MLVRAVCTLLSALVLSLPARSAVTQIDLVSRQQLPASAAVPPYEYLVAKVHFAVNPKAAANRIVNDIDLAARNPAGRVEFSADLEVIRPIHRADSNGTALVEISNRGGKSLFNEFDFAQGPFDAKSSASLGDGFLLKHGFTLVWIGWEFDVPDKPGLLRAYLPVATAAGKQITGLVRSEWTGDEPVTTISLGDKGQIGYPVLDPTSPKNRLLVRDTVLGSRTSIPHNEWSFVDATHVKLQDGFTPGRIYEAIYEAKDPAVAGLGLAAVRDFTSYLKYGGAASPLDLAHSSPHAIAFGVSQSGRFLREYLFDGFNVDEAERPVFDGVWAHVAGAGRGSFNERFAQPSRDGHAFYNVLYPVDVPPFNEEALLEKSHRAHVVPKLFLTNGSYEYWSRCASLIHTTADGKADQPPSDQARIYFFSGSQHTAGAIPPHPAPSQNPANVNDYRCGLRVLLLAMQNWVAHDTAPPASVFPRLERNELTPLAGLRFPAVSGLEIPEHKREAYRLDFSVEPPRTGDPFPTFVPQVDRDGNELGGIQMPEVAVPLASYTGWNLRSPAIGAPEQLLPFLGSWIPFAEETGERDRTKDGRPSLGERYASEPDYLEKIDAAIERLVKQGFLLGSDAPLLHERADNEWKYRRSL